MIAGEGEKVSRKVQVQGPLPGSREKKEASAFGSGDTLFWGKRTVPTAHGLVTRHYLKGLRLPRPGGGGNVEDINGRSEHDRGNSRWTGCKGDKVRWAPLVMPFVENLGGEKNRDRSLVKKPSDEKKSHKIIGPRVGGPDCGQSVIKENTRTLRARHP